MKFLDYGKMAATFVNLETGQAVRVVAVEEARERAKAYFPHIREKSACQMEAYKVMPDEELFSWQRVLIRIPREDMPGKPLTRVRCEGCGEHVQDLREVRRGGRTLCRPCAQGSAYFFEFRYAPMAQRTVQDLPAAGKTAAGSGG
jgi:formylmethanofuran dehydrogenase subunit E